MRERITTIMEFENLSPTKFAEILKIQPSNISHLLSGRNKPSFELLGKLLAAFPHISGDWLITGEGNYKKIANDIPKDLSIQHKGLVAPSLFDQIPQLLVSDDKKPSPKSDTTSNDPKIEHESTEIDQKAPSSTVKNASIAGKLSKIVFIYDDNTFEEITPRSNN